MSKLDGETENKPHEINSNSSTFEKRKRKSKKKHCTYLHEWLDKSYEVREESSGLYRPDPDHLLNHPSPYWPHASSGQRVFADGATMCHYPVPPVPLGYAVEPFYTMYQPSMQVNPTWTPRGMHTAQPTREQSQRLPRSNPPPQANRSVWMPGKPSARNGPLHADQSSNTDLLRQEFASLPPDNQSRDSDASQRRFSDPGLGPSPSGNEQSDAGTNSTASSSSRGSSPTGGLVLSLVEQVNALRNSNKQLCRQLRDTRSELQTLKLQVATWKQTQPTTDYQPGLLADLVREVRDASRIREEALLSRLHNLSMGSGSMPNGEKMPQVTITEQRLARLEQQLMKVNQANSNSDLPLHARGHVLAANLNTGIEAQSSLPNPIVIDVDPEKAELRCKLQEALGSRKEVEAHAEKLEKLVGILRKKINGLSLDEKADHCPSSLEFTSESLASICSSNGSTHSPLVTMSGPVTDL